MKTHLLIDGDVIAFAAASATQAIYEDEFGLMYPVANPVVACATADNMLWALEQGLKADSYEVVLSDAANWRHAVDPSYKGNRDPAMRPLALSKVRDHLREKHGAYSWKNLEADDVLGILATQRVTFTDNINDLGWREQIVVGRDKDFKSIPGRHHQLKDTWPDGTLRVRERSQWEADRWHMVQSLAGDRVDGYAGCPGLGVDRAERIVDKPVILRPRETTVTRGPRKGEQNVTWDPEPTADYWACIVSHYEKALYDPQANSNPAEHAALTTARLARILRHGEYDRETGEVRLWEFRRTAWRGGCDMDVLLMALAAAAVVIFAGYECTHPSAPPPPDTRSPAERHSLRAIFTTPEGCKVYAFQDNDYLTHHFATCPGVVGNTQRVGKSGASRGRHTDPGGRRMTALPLKVINLFAGPGAGKSTAAAGLFNLMKNLGCSVELVTEFAKDTTWEKNYGVLQNQLVMLAEQDRRLRRLSGQVEWAITDSPLPLSLAYMTPEYEAWLPGAIWGAFRRYDNHCYLIRRTKPYVMVGRNQTEIEARRVDVSVQGIFDEAALAGVVRTQGLDVNGDRHAPYVIAGDLGIISYG